jgi:hypothetical protein
MSPEEITAQQDIEFYASSVDAWYNSALEHDKSLLALSAGGIGLLVTLLTTVGPASAAGLVLYVIAIMAFLATIGFVLWIFRRNRDYIQGLFSGKGKIDDPVLARLDTMAALAFGIGVAFTAVVGVAAAIHSYTASSKEKVMSNESAKKSEPTIAHDSVNGAGNLQQRSDLKESFNKAGGLQASETVKKSFNTAGALRPGATASQQGSTTTGQSTTTVPAGGASTPPPPQTSSQGKSGTGK